MKTYIYSGPATTLAFHSASGKLLWEGALHPTRPVNLPDALPDDHPHLAALVATGHLTRSQGEETEAVSIKQTKRRVAAEDDTNG